MGRVLDSFRLDDQVAIVTGGSEGLGFDAACALAEAGANVVLTSRRLERAQRSCDRIRSEFGVDTLALVMDQCVPEQVRDMATRALAWKGRVDILVNNAGGGSGRSEGDLFRRSSDEIAALIATNLTGSLLCCKEVAPAMAGRGSGKIINIASIAGLVGRDRRMYHRNDKREQPVDYAAAKAGVIGMTYDLAAYLAPKGVHVNCISPGGFDRGELPPGFVRDFADEAMLGRMGRIGVDLKGAVLFLASSASDYVTGHNLVVDGGFSRFK